MPTSPYFDFWRNTPEKQLIQNLFNESIKIHGANVYYIPRESEDTVDYLFGDDPLSKFDEAYIMEMYTSSFEGWDGDREIMSKFGLEIRDEVTFICTKQIFQSRTNLQFTRPKEGDLIYFPQTRALFEIKFVEDEKPFYQLGNRFAYELQCERVRYSHEKLDTGVAEIDEIEDTYSFSMNIQVSAGGSGDFILEEVAYQGSNIASATAQGTVLSWNSTTRILKVNNIQGVFTSNTAVKGVTSSANWTVSSLNPVEHISDTLADNEQLQDEADVLIVPKNNDFTGNTP